MTNTTQLMSGSTLMNGKYRILKVLGQGGFGITYLAEQTALDRKVAIKEFFMKDYCNREADTSHVSVPTIGSQELVEKFKQKFLKESKTIAALNHPNIIRIYDVFEENDTAYYVMEYLPGGSLDSYVTSRGFLDSFEAVNFIRQIGMALTYIHRRNINHLDVKPSNILLDANNRAVLIDFGLSKRYDEAGMQTSSTPVGISHGYAPLEQYKAGGVNSFSPTCDVYSLGATLYKLVTGQTPPDAMTLTSEGFQEIPDYVAPYLVKAIMQAMQSKPCDRPQTVSEFLSLLNNHGVDNDESTVIAQPVASGQPPFPKHKSDDSSNNKDKTKSSKLKLILSIILSLVALLAILAGVYVIKFADFVSDETVVTINTKPDNVKVFFDGDSLGVTPISNLSLKKGKHVLVLKKDGYEVVVDSLEFTGDSSVLNKELKQIVIKPVVPQTSKLYVTTVPDGAAVYLDGKKIGVTPIDSKSVVRGNHTIKISKEGYKTHTATRQIGEDPLVINLSLQPAPVKAETAKFSKLYVTTNPSGAKVYLDGEDIGTSPINGLSKPQGRHTIKLECSGYETFNCIIDFSSDPIIINESLKPIKSGFASTGVSSYASVNQFFPVYGIVLGKTTTKAMKDMGYSVKTIDSGSHVCNVRSLSFWDHDKDNVYESIYITHGDVLPEKWENLGLSFRLSYNNCIRYFENIGYSISIKKSPEVVLYQDRKTLSAKFLATSPDKHLTFELSFNYGNDDGEGYSENSPNSLYSISVGFIQ